MKQPDVSGCVTVYPQEGRQGYSRGPTAQVLLPFITVTQFTSWRGSREGERTLLDNCFCRPCVVCSGDLCAVPQAANDSVPPWYSETSCREGEETEKTDKGDAQSPTAKTESQWLEKSRVEKDGGGENKARKTLGKGAAGMGNMEVLTAREIDC